MTEGWRAPWWFWALWALAVVIVVGAVVAAGIMLERCSGCEKAREKLAELPISADEPEFKVTVADCGCPCLRQYIDDYIDSLGFVSCYTLWESGVCEWTLEGSTVPGATCQPYPEP